MRPSNKFFIGKFRDFFGVSVFLTWMIKIHKNQYSEVFVTELLRLV